MEEFLSILSLVNCKHFGRSSVAKDFQVVLHIQLDVTESSLERLPLRLEEDSDRHMFLPFLISVDEHPSRVLVELQNVTIHSCQSSTDQTVVMCGLGVFGEHVQEVIEFSHHPGQPVEEGSKVFRKVDK